MTIDDVIYTLGIPGDLRGHDALSAGVEIMIDDPSVRYEAISRLYPEIARRVGSTPTKVERNIRTAIERCWKKGNRKFLNMIARYELQHRPSSVEFMDMISAYVIWKKSKEKERVKV